MNIRIIEILKFTLNMEYDGSYIINKSDSSTGWEKRYIDKILNRQWLQDIYKRITINSYLIHGEELRCMSN